MILGGLVDLIARDNALAEAVSRASQGTARTFDLTCPASVRPFVAAALAGSGRPILIVTSTYREAEQLTAAIGQVIGADAVEYYPAWETLPHERLSPRSDTVGRRLAVLRRVAGFADQPAPRVVVAPVRAVVQPQVAGLARMRPVTLSVGDEYDLTRLAADLVAAAYNRVDLVERRGEFAVRGGIVDIFPPTEPHPVRIDFFGDEIDTITYFTVADQRSSDHEVRTITAPPCRELLITDEVRSRAAALAPDHPELAEMLDKIAAGQAVEGMEALTPALVDDLELLVEVFPADTIVLVADPELVRSRADDLVRTSSEFLQAGWAAAASGGKAPIDLGAAAYQDLSDVRLAALGRGQSWWGLSPFAASPGVDDANCDAEASELPGETIGIESHRMNVEPLESLRGDAEGTIERMRAGLRDGWRVVLAASGKGIAARMTEVLADHDLAARIVESVPNTPDPAVVTIAITDLSAGFRAVEGRLTVITVNDLGGEATRVERTMPARRKNQVQPLELRAGEPLVHEQHGVGRFVEMMQRTVAGATREYLVIEYAPSKRGQPGDRLYVPMDQLDQVTRYVGGETPTLDRMGGADWRARKARARKAVRQIAGELIKLYAARQATRGHAFAADTVWQRELEDAFTYTETPDQLAAIDEVKHDMEQVVPMDRLICGDVGYGKTEIAVRAAFKAIQDGKQVAVLVPTTLLVQQHYQTFAGRYAGFPVSIAQLSRFQSDAETKDAIDGLESGRVDLVIGTHRLLSDQITFKDLGLVIIDEEQRFGVEHKERLKQLRVNVDVLSMSATPIPRTLEMAVTGIREMSVIATPPEERHPVLTFAGPFDEGQVGAAIRRELAREGQVFYIHNKVNSIEKAAAKIRELVPEARVETAHGQMGEKRLEAVMENFWQRRADVLVCTTIVEAGIDISSANTLIIERADTLGLSQLHQLRGRVGRSRERGYAYLLYPADKPLSETAHDRLATMASNTDLGAGMAIAMKDLEIRGAGNLLGGEQSGHIADVGFDLYIRLVGEAMAEYKGEAAVEEPEVRIELPVDAHLPEDYVESERLRLEMYKRLAEVRHDADIDAIRDELIDRYGPVPEAAAALLDVARFRLQCRAAGLTEVMPQGTVIRFGPAQLPESRKLRLARLYPGAVIKEQAGLVLVPRPMTASIGGRPMTGTPVLEWASEVVDAIFTPIVKAPEATSTGPSTPAAAH